MQSLKEKYADYFKIGAAVSERTIVSHRDLLLQHFNSITCENAMKYGQICRNHEYRFDKADAIYNFGVSNGLAVRGHTFVWHQAIPEAVFEQMSGDDLFSLICKHMSLMSERYPEIYCWDVVNEAVFDGENGDFYRDTVWRRKLGEDFIYRLFTAARELLPRTALYYNDYGEMWPHKRERICELIRQMKGNGTPVDGVGLQCHINIFSPALDEYKRVFEDYAKLGVKLQVTELDISIYNFDKGEKTELTPELAEKQASVYADYFKLFREYHEIIEAVSLWGVADDATWLDWFPVNNRKDYPLLFDMNHEPKEAFNRIMDF